MVDFVDTDKPGIIQQTTYNRFKAGDNVCFVGKSRRSIFTNLLHWKTMRGTKITLDAQEHVYVFFGHYWQSLAGDQKSMKKEWWSTFRTDGMKGAGHDAVVKGLRPHRRFFYFTKKPNCGIFQFEKSLLVDTITNATPNRADVPFGPHVNTIMENAKSSKNRVWTYQK